MRDVVCEEREEEVKQTKRRPFFDCAEHKIIARKESHWVSTEKQHKLVS